VARLQLRLVVLKRLCWLLEECRFSRYSHGDKARRVKNRLRIWRKIMRLIFGRFLASREKERLQRSYTSPVIVGHLRDSFRYYENGRWVTVSGELMAGHDPQRVIFRNCPLKWNDSGPPLTSGEREKVFRKIGEYLDGKKVSWEFSDAVSETWKSSAAMSE